MMVSRDFLLHPFYPWRIVLAKVSTKADIQMMGKVNPGFELFRKWGMAQSMPKHGHYSVTVGLKIESRSKQRLYLATK